MRAEKNDHSTADFYVLIVAAGEGSRFGGFVPKQYCEIHGKPVLRHTVENFLRLIPAEHIHIVINPDHEDLYQRAVAGLDLPEYVVGGDQRKNSVYKGLQSFLHLKYEDKILIHDAARPFTDPKDILKLVQCLGAKQAASLAVPVTDTIRYKNGQEVSRENLWALQTPQGFHYGVLKTAHEKFCEEGNYTDDTKLLENMGVEVEIVQGSGQNIKITHKEDLELAEGFLKKQMHVGLGYDVHSFCQNRGGPLLLCGVKIPYERRLSGHSDADAGLHAVTDALLGAIGAGDIGEHFPPSDPVYKDQDSAVFLKKALDMMRAKGGALVNIDVTLICEEPKLGPYKLQMASRLAAIAAIVPENVNVKATTTEKLGFTGRKEGIAAQAIVTVELPHA